MANFIFWEMQREMLFMGLLAVPFALYMWPASGGGRCATARQGLGAEYRMKRAEGGYREQGAGRCGRNFQDSEFRASTQFEGCLVFQSSVDGKYLMRSGQWLCESKQFIS